MHGTILAEIEAACPLLLGENWLVNFVDAQVVQI